MTIKPLKFYHPFLILLLLQFACSSPLEEVEIDDFNLINVSINVIKEVSSNGEIEDVVKLGIHDKNWKGFELKKGTVHVNGQKMVYDNRFLDNAYRSDLKITPNTSYEFVIVLSNGESASSTLKTPAISINSIHYNKEIDLNENYTISWDKVNQPVLLIFFLDDQINAKSPSYYLNKIFNGSAGHYIVNAEDMKHYPHATRCIFELNYLGEKQLSTKFRNSVATVKITYIASDVTLK